MIFSPGLSNDVSEVGASGMNGGFVLMKYEKLQLEVIMYDTDMFMATSFMSSEFATSGLKDCQAVTWAGRYSAEPEKWPLIDCRAVTFGNGNYKDDQLYSVPCKTYMP